MNFFYTRTILENHIGGGHENRKYIAVPVKVFKVIATFARRPEINHFERAILSICLNGYHDSKTISDLLLIDKDLARYIVFGLVEKGLLSKSEGTTEDGKEKLAGVESKIECKPYYVFFDLNSNSLLSDTVAVEKLKIQDAAIGKKEYEKRTKVLTITDEISSISLKVDLLDYSKKMNGADSKLRNRVRKECSGLNFEGELRSIDVLENEDKGYLITYVESGEEMCVLSRWTVASPFCKGQECEQIRAFLSDNVSDAFVNKLIADVLSGVKDKKKVDLMKNLRDVIENELFSTPVPEKYELITIPLSRILKPLSIDRNLDPEIQKKDHGKNVALNFIELVEDIFYLASFEDGFDMNGVVLDYSKGNNSLLLVTFARNLGFICDSNVAKLLEVTSNSVEKSKINSRGRVIGPVTALAILGNQKLEDGYLRKMAHKYPGLLQELYCIKRLFRDKLRHSVNNATVDVDYYRDMSLFLLDVALGLKAKNEVVNELLAAEENVDYSLSREIVRSYFGNEFNEFNGNRVANMRMELINGYENYYNKQPNYLANIRAVLEDSFFGILNKELKNNPLNLNEDFDPFNVFDSGYSMLVNLRKHKLLIEPLLEEQGDTEYPFRYGNNASIEKKMISDALSGGLRNANFSVKLKCFAILLKVSPPFKKRIEKWIDSQEAGDSVKYLLSLVVAVMYLDKSHSQNTVFVQSDADTIVEKTLQILSDLYKYTDLLDWR